MNEFKGFLAVLGVGTSVFTYLAQIAPPLPFGADKPINRIEKAVTGEIVTPEVRKEVPLLSDTPQIQKEMRASPNFANVVDEHKEEVDKALVRFEEQCRTVDTRTEGFISFDKTVESSRQANAMMLRDLEKIFRINNKSLKSSLANYKSSLEFAPILYREMAADSYRLAKEQTNPEYVEFYENNARTNENFAIQAENRHTLFFGQGADSIANVIERKVDTYQSLYQLHSVWKKTLDNWPSTLDNPDLGGYLAGIETHMQYLRRFNESIRKLNEAMERNEPLPLENPRAEPEPDAEPAAAPAPAPKPTAIPVRTVSVQLKTKRQQPSLKTASGTRTANKAPQAPAPAYDRHRYYELVNGQWVLRETLIPAGQP